MPCRLRCTPEALPCTQLALLPLRGLGAQAAGILASIASGEASASTASPRMREASPYLGVLRLLVQPGHLSALVALAGSAAELDQARQVLLAV